MNLMKDHVVFLGLGGNIGDTFTILNEALKKIELLAEVSKVEVSSFFRTAPFNCIPMQMVSQINNVNHEFINIVCCLHTSYSLSCLFDELKNIEVELGKTPKPKNYPRKIDIDILFFNDEVLSTKSLNIPHLHWKERLFVLVPLLDLMETKGIEGPFGMKKHDLKAIISRFSDTERQEIVKL